MPVEDFEIKIAVRDYECDLQGIVNNAVYQNYLEHARHSYIKKHGVDFAETTAAGIHLVVVRAELDYKAPLKSGDDCVVTVRPDPISVVRFAFLQDIYRLPERQLCVRAKITCAAIGLEGRPMKLPKKVQRLVGLEEADS